MARRTGTPRTPRLTSPVALVVAYSANRVIGRDGGLPWHLPADLSHFKKVTANGTVVMGRRTWNSLPDRRRPLPDRQNIVLSRDVTFDADGAQVLRSLDAAISAANGCCFVIGGAALFEQALDVADTVHATVIDADIDGDTFFPELNPDVWRCAERSATVEQAGLRFSFCRYDRAPRRPARAFPSDETDA